MQIDPAFSTIERFRVPHLTCHSPPVAHIQPATFNSHSPGCLGPVRKQQRLCPHPSSSQTPIAPRRVAFVPPPQTTDITYLRKLAKRPPLVRHHRRRPLPNDKGEEDAGTRQGGQSFHLPFQSYRLAPWHHRGRTCATERCRTKARQTAANCGRCWTLIGMARKEGSVQRLTDFADIHWNPAGTSAKATPIFLPRSGSLWR